MSRQQWLFVIMCHVGMILCSIMRTNFNMALVAMVGPTKKNGSIGLVESECLGNTTVGNTTLMISRSDPTSPDRQTFDWNEEEQGYLLGAVSYGAIFTISFMGYFSDKFGGKWVFGVSILIGGVSTILIPVCARWSLVALIICRVAIGMSTAPVIVASQTLIPKWIQAEHRTKANIFVKSGVYAGMLISYPMTGVLSSADFLGGWPSVFYVTGGAALLFFVIWTIVVKENLSPSSIAKHMINVEGKASGQKMMPWRAIFTNKYLLVMYLSHFTTAWLYILLTTALPFYFKNILNIDIKESGFLQMLPYLSGIVFSNAAGVFADIVRKRCHSLTATRKLMHFISTSTSSVCIIAAGYMGCQHKYVTVVLVALAFGFNLVNQAGAQMVALDIAPRFAAVIYGVSSTFVFLAASVCPIVTGALTNNQITNNQYKKVFGIAAGLSCASCLAFLLFSTAEKQPWNDIGLSAAEVEEEGVSCGEREERADASGGGRADKPLMASVHSLNTPV